MEEINTLMLVGAIAVGLIALVAAMYAKMMGRLEALEEELNVTDDWVDSVDRRVDRLDAVTRHRGDAHIGDFLDPEPFIGMVVPVHRAMDAIREVLDAEVKDDDLAGILERKIENVLVKLAGTGD